MPAPSTAVLDFLTRQRDQALAGAGRLLAESRSDLRSGGGFGWADSLDAHLDDAARAVERLERLDRVVAVRRETHTYRPDGPHSFFIDLVKHRTGDQSAGERLARHREEVAEEVQRRNILRRRAWERGADRYGLVVERRDLTRVDGSGGHFVPPLHLLDQFGALPRAGRVLTDRLSAIPLPAGADSISVPRLTTGTATAIQTADNTAVQETDLVDASVTAPVRTIAGQADAALQLVDQSGPPGFDRVVYADLFADYNSKLESQVIAGSGAAGQLSGLLTAPLTSVTYTSATPTVAATVSKIGDLAAQVSTARQLVPSVALMAPRRGFWLMSQADAQARPFNPIDLAGAERDPNAEPTGSLYGMALVLDPAIPTNLGAGTNEDRVIVTRAADHLLLESEPRLTLNLDVGSATLTARFGLHRYVAFAAGRVPSSTGVLAGTGLATPTFT